MTTKGAMKRWLRVVALWVLVALAWQAGTWGMWATGNWHTAAVVVNTVLTIAVSFLTIATLAWGSD